GASHEGKSTSEVFGYHGHLQLRQHVHDAVDPGTAAACRGLLVLPPVLYRQAEDRRYGRARGALQAEIRAYRRQGRLGPVLGSGTQRQLRAARPPKGSPRAAFCLQAAGERSAAMPTSAKSAAAI